MKKKLTLFVVTLVLLLGMCCGTAFATNTGPGDMAGIVDVISDLAIFAGATLTVLGILTVAVQVIVQVTKNWPFIRSMPTDLWVFIVSITICELALFILAAWVGFLVLWYYIVMAVFMAMTVAFVAMFGWKPLKELYDRYMIQKLKT